MSWLSQGVKAVGKGLTGLGHDAGKVLSNPIVDAGLTFIPGLGPVAAGAAAGVGNLLKPGGNIGSAVKGGLTTGALGALTGAAGKIPGVGGLLSKLGSMPGGLSKLAGLIPGIGGLGQKLGSFISQNPAQAAGLASSALDSARARGLETEAINAARQGYDSRAGLRAKGVAGLMNPIRPDLSGLIDSGNPYAKKIPAIPMSGAAAPMPTGG